MTNEPTAANLNEQKRKLAAWLLAGKKIDMVIAHAQLEIGALPQRILNLKQQFHFPIVSKGDNGKAEWQWYITKSGRGTFRVKVYQIDPALFDDFTASFSIDQEFEKDHRGRFVTRQLQKAS